SASPRPRTAGRAASAPGSPPPAATGRAGGATHRRTGSTWPAATSACDGGEPGDNAMTPAGRFVPQVPPATRPAEADDPLEMHAIPLPGDPELMLRCVVEEYARAGWDAGQVLGLFEDPFFPALAGLRRHFGAAGLRERVTDLVGRTGVFQLRVT